MVGETIFFRVTRMGGIAGGASSLPRFFRGPGPHAHASLIAILTRSIKLIFH